MRDSIATILGNLGSSAHYREKLIDGIIESLRALSPNELRQIKRFLSTIESPWRGFFWKRRFARFQSLSESEQINAIRRAIAGSKPTVRCFLKSLYRQLAYFQFALPESDLMENSNWSEMGYALLRGANLDANEALRPARIRTNQSSFAADYLVIGSGAGGSVTAAELAETGKRILVVEAGPIPTPGELGQSESFANHHWSEIFGALNTPRQPVTLTAGRMLGGGTVLSWGSCVDPSTSLLNDWAARFGFVDCIGESYRHSLYSVRRRLGIETCKSLNQNNQLLLAACEKLNWNISPYEQNRGACSVCCTCGFGCAGGKQDALRTYLLDASRLGVQFLPACRIEKFEVRDGRAERAVGMLQDETGQYRPVEFLFRHAVLSAGAIHSPSILLRSGLSNPHIGQHLQLQPTAVILAEFDQPIEAWNGPPQSLGCTQFSSRADGLAFRIECVPLHPGFLAMNLPWPGSADHRKWMIKARYLAGLIVSVQDNQDRLGQIRLDRNGQVQLEYRSSRSVCLAIADGIKAAMTCLRAAGAKRVFAPVASIKDFDLSHSQEQFEDYCRHVANACRDATNLTLWSAFPSSTCRISSSANKGAVDTSGRVFGLNNVFVCDAAGLPTATCVPPLITVTTTAHFLSQKIKQLTN